MTQDLQRYVSQEPAAPDSAPTALGVFQVLWRRLWLVALILAVSLITAAVVSKRTPKAWRASAQMLLVQHASILAPTAEASANAPMVESIDTQISLLQSHEIAEQAARVAGTDADTLQAATTVEPPKQTNVIDLSVEAGSRAEAASWANAMCNAFVAYKNFVARSSSEETITSLGQQMRRAQAQRDAADHALLAFQKTHHLVDVPTQATAALNQYLQRDAEVATLQGDAASAEERASSLKARLDQEDAKIRKGNGVRDDTQAQSLQAKLNDLEMRRVETAQRYRSKFPGQLSALDAQIADTKARLRQAINTTTSNLSPQAESTLRDQYSQAATEAGVAQAKLTEARALRDRLKQQTVSLPEISMAASRLSRSADQAHSLYASLESAMRAAQLNKDIASGNVQIVQHAFVPEEPFRPNHKRDLLIGGAIGVCLSLLAVLLLEQSDRSLRTAQDVRRLASGPVVGVLPQMTRTQRRQLAGGETPPQLMETYNAARANLALALRLETGADLSNHQVLLVSSALSGEGKSLTAYEMARSFARSGKRVVLINADMRRPSSVPILRNGKGPGLAEVLTGEATLEDALVDSDTHNMSILHSGRPAGNPMDLIALPQMRDLIGTLRQAADVVVVDSPPAAVVADALLIAPHADCVLFVVGVGQVDAETVRYSSAALAAAAPKTMAYFINRAPQVSQGPRNASYLYYRQAPARDDVALPANYQSTRTMVLERVTLTEHSGGSPNGGAQPVLRPLDAMPPPPTIDMDKVSEDSRSSGARVLPQIGSRLMGIEGPYFGQVFSLPTHSPIKIGSHPDSDIVLSRDGTISQTHAQIIQDPRGYVIHDEYSTNGTFVNGVRIRQNGLNVGDIVQLGTSKFRYE